MKIAFSTLGCKINQYDSALMKESLKERFQIVSFDDIADVYVINTCTVTAKSDYQSRQLVRRAVKKNEKAKIIVAGCYPQGNPEAFVSIDGVDIILGNQEKLELERYLKDTEKEQTPRVYVNKTADAFFHSDLKAFPNRTRAVLKVQDGCSAYCAFCIVPYVRGKARSAKPEWVIKQINNFVDVGYKEIVLSGVSLGTYGKEISSEKSLSWLVKEILKHTEIQRIRISSIEPEDVTDELIDLVASEDRICKHLHLPLQSGDDGILSRMKRQYDSAYFRKIILKVKEGMPEIGLGTDIIVGLPGEDDTAYGNSVRMIEELPFTYIHVFSYSQRRGTEAFDFKEQVSEPVKKERSRRLIEIGKSKSMLFKKGYINKTVNVLIESEKDKKTGMLKGLTENYMKVFVKDEKKDLKNKMVPVIIVEGDMCDGLIGRIV
ncbi:MAG: tRNA (N(6)-L-threonylcarbamoyladenosine(37)-C(2))-methylthiotransferase MtaB [Nitrospirae bacterium]|nr:tRNA (N(6)-L-threonylcarbamoyladenosine(37)-C(2))-methylthiotransferase MtaB [Nitrospirota bacterium]